MNAGFPIGCPRRRVPWRISEVGSKARAWLRSDRLGGEREAEGEDREREVRSLVLERLRTIPRRRPRRENCSMYQGRSAKGRRMVVSSK
jgi:hypothetical protein